MNAFNEEQDPSAEQNDNEDPQAEAPSIFKKASKVFVVLALALLIVLAIIAKRPPHRSEGSTQTEASGDEGSSDAAQEGFTPETVLATVNGQTITLAELDKAMQDLPDELQAFFAADQHRLLSELVVRELLIEEAKALKITETEAYAEAVAAHPPHPGHEDETLIGVLIDEKVFAPIQVSDEELHDFYERNKARLPEGQTFEDVADGLRQRLVETKASTALQDYITSLKKRAKITLNSDWIEAQKEVAADNPLDRVLGKGKPVLADFGRNTCPPCRMMKPILEKLAEDLKDSVHVVIIDLDEYPQLGDRYRFRYIPAQVFFDGNGKELSPPNEGFMPREDLLSKMKELGMLPQ